MKMKYELILDQIKCAFERLKYIQEKGEKIVEKYYDYNVSFIVDDLEELLQCLRDGTWGEKEKENWG